MKAISLCVLSVDHLPEFFGNFRLCTEKVGIFFLARDIPLLVEEDAVDLRPSHHSEGGEDHKGIDRSPARVINTVLAYTLY